MLTVEEGSALWPQDGPGDFVVFPIGDARGKQVGVLLTQLLYRSEVSEARHEFGPGAGLNTLAAVRLALRLIDACDGWETAQTLLNGPDGVKDGLERLGRMVAAGKAFGLLQEELVRVAKQGLSAIKEAGHQEGLSKGMRTGGTIRDDTVRRLLDAALEPSEALRLARLRALEPSIRQILGTDHPR